MPLKMQDVQGRCDIPSPYFQYYVTAASIYLQIGRVVGIISNWLPVNSTKNQNTIHQDNSFFSSPDVMSS